MGLFSRTPKVDPQIVDGLRQKIGELSQRQDVSDRARADVDAQMHQFEVATAALAARSHMIDEVTLRMAEVEVLKRQMAQLDVVNARITSLEGMNAKLAELADRVTASADDAEQAKRGTAALNERLSNISTELANQLGELSRDLDGLANQGAGVHGGATDAGHDPAATDEMLDHLQTAQIRLAHEQARYEIAFRQDLASLADQLRRSRIER